MKHSANFPHGGNLALLIPFLLWRSMSTMSNKLSTKRGTLLSWMHRKTFVISLFLPPEWFKTHLGSRKQGKGFGFCSYSAKSLLLITRKRSKSCKILSTLQTFLLFNHLFLNKGARLTGAYSRSLASFSKMIIVQDFKVWVLEHSWSLCKWCSWPCFF